MKRVSGITLVCLLCFVSLVFGQSDREGTDDYPGIGRVPGYYIDDYSTVPFDSVTFQVTKDGQKSEQQVAGHVIKIHYSIKQDTPATSMLQVIRNYQYAAESAGGEVLDDSKGDNWYNTTLRLTRGGKEIWILVAARGDNHSLTIVERQATQREVTIDAASMASGLNADGKVSLYGIYFDDAKSGLKPESEPTLAEIAKLLKAIPTMNVAIVGHTDMAGDLAADVSLSQARAQSVITVLVAKYGIDVSRLTPFGNGAYAPVASNKSAEGRAKNRRIELVEITTRR